MVSGILGSKGKMSHTFIEGTRVPVTYVKTGPCVVTQIKSKDKDGYWGIQIGFGEKRIKNVTKPLQGHLRGVLKDKKAPLFLREIRVKSEPELKVGDILTVDKVFKKGDLIAVTGTSKGKGFAGVVKRWGFAGGPKTHGQSDRERAPGSIGAGTTPGRIWKGKKMGGRMGTEKVTVKNLIIVDVNPELGEVAVSGAIPGKKGGLLLLTKLGSGKLSELVQETHAQIVEGEPEEAGEGKEEGSDEGPAEPKTEEKREE